MIEMFAVASEMSEYQRVAGDIACHLNNLLQYGNREVQDMLRTKLDCSLDIEYQVTQKPYGTGQVTVLQLIDRLCGVRSDGKRNLSRIQVGHDSGVIKFVATPPQTTETPGGGEP